MGQMPICEDCKLYKATKAFNALLLCPDCFNYANQVTLNRDERQWKNK
jgi:hypothetical protein